MLQNDYVLETSRSIGVSRSDGIRLQFLYGRLLMNRHRRMDPLFDLEISYVRAEPVACRQTDNQ
jgi:hypothetical protein